MYWVRGTEGHGRMRPWRRFGVIWWWNPRNCDVLRACIIHKLRMLVGGGVVITRLHPHTSWWIHCVTVVPWTKVCCHSLLPDPTSSVLTFTLWHFHIAAWTQLFKYRYNGPNLLILCHAPEVFPCVTFLDCRFYVMLTHIHTHTHWHVVIPHVFIFHDHQ
jgi:hypothetical protein